MPRPVPIFAAIFCCIVSLKAHTLPISYMNIVAGDRYLHLELVLNPFELNFFSEIDSNKNSLLDPEELKLYERAISGRMLDCIKLKVGGEHIKPEISGISVDPGDHHLVLRAHYRAGARLLGSRPLSIGSNLSAVTSSAHATVVKYVSGGRTQSALLDVQSNSVTFRPADLRNGNGCSRKAISMAIAFKRQLLVAALILAILLSAYILKRRRL